MKKQKVMSQMKRQGKIPGKRLNEVEIGNLPKKIIQNNDSEDNPASQENYEEDSINVYQRLRRIREQTNRAE